MGASYGKKRTYSIDQDPPRTGVKTRRQNPSRADVQQHHAEGVHRRAPPTCSSAHQTNVQSEDVELIKPRKLQNPVKSSRSHQELHRELLSRRGCVEMKPELQRVLESRKREQLIRQRKQEDDAHRKMSPLEAELRKRHDKLDELERQQEQQQQQDLRAPEFIKVKENLRRTSICKDEKMV
ncbi:protein FAM107B-like [Salarias fasciatus]|uniref:protein FAM107B-like n=1 Tax=Salarias fasciatus TaxID=181472 RepID=UPI00117660A1|nr:protein FAM107B-like [Salarias fasciatus]